MTGSVPCFVLFYFSALRFLWPRSCVKGRVHLFSLGAPAQKRLLSTGPGTQLCSKAPLLWGGCRLHRRRAEPNRKQKQGQPNEAKQQPQKTWEGGAAKDLEPKWIETKWLRVHVYQPTGCRNKIPVRPGCLRHGHGIVDRPRWLTDSLYWAGPAAVIRFVGFFFFGFALFFSLARPPRTAYVHRARRPATRSVAAAATAKPNAVQPKSHQNRSGGPPDNRTRGNQLNGTR